MRGKNLFCTEMRRPDKLGSWRSGSVVAFHPRRREGNKLVAHQRNTRKWRDKSTVIHHLNLTLPRQKGPLQVGSSDVP